MNISVLMYTKPNCPNCDSAKKLLRTKRLNYTEFNVEDDHNRMALDVEHPGVKQLPVIEVNGQYVGGFAGLQAALKQLGI